MRASHNLMALDAVSVDAVHYGGNIAHPSGVRALPVCGAPRGAHYMIFTV
jgi:hypothetical protein